MKLLAFQKALAFKRFNEPSIRKTNYRVTPMKHTLRQGRERVVLHAHILRKKDN